MEDKRDDSDFGLSSGTGLLAELSSSLSLDMAVVRIQTARKRDCRVCASVEHDQPGMMKMVDT